MSPSLAPLLAAALLAGPSTPSTPSSAGRAEAALVQCWAKEVTTPCTSRRTPGDDAAVEACKEERAKTACATERAAAEKELAGRLARDTLDLLAVSIKDVCAAEAAGRFNGKLTPEQEAAIASGWRDALDVRSEYMRACEKAGREARECDDTANQAERKARADFCAIGN
jgi:hypothetical protein